jgi:alkylation response protein AidB-like acyl-CoA dehydrogenase
MDFAFSDHFAEQREAARQWVHENTRPEWAVAQHATGNHHTDALHAALARDGILGAGVPSQFGGSTVEPAFAQAVFAELAVVGLYCDAWSTTRMVIRTIESEGTEEQKQHVIPAAVRGEVRIALGYTEPDSGSDVAAAKTRAIRDGDEWVINGQKMFTSSAQACTHVFLLTRTDPDVPKHKGLTMFLVPTDSPGFELQPVYTLGGQRTNATFYTDLRVADSARVGDVDKGWSVMHVALVHERAGGGRGRGGPSLAARVAAWARTHDVAGGHLYDVEPTVPGRLARIAIDEEVTKLLVMRVDWMSQIGEVPGVEGSMAKLYSSEAAQRHYSDLLDMLGPEGVLQGPAHGAALDGELEAGFRASVVGTILGGSSEVQREIIAERRLGLPRSRPKQ